MPTTSNDLLGTLIPEWQSLLQGWALDGSLAAAAQEALLLNGEPPALQDLINQWGSGDFRSLPPIVLLPSADISGAMGAYAISTGTIYLNADWLEGATRDQVFAVLTEELGHHLDGVLNAVDTPGDEGEYFSWLLLRNGESIDYSRDGGDDQIAVNVLGEKLIAEAASINDPSPFGDPWKGSAENDQLFWLYGGDYIDGLAGYDVLNITQLNRNQAVFSKNPEGFDVLELNNNEFRLTLFNIEKVSFADQAEVLNPPLLDIYRLDPSPFGDPWKGSAENDQLFWLYGGDYIDGLAGYDVLNITQLNRNQAVFSKNPEGFDVLELNNNEFRLTLFNIEKVSFADQAEVLNPPLSRKTPVFRGNSLYTIANGPSWSQAEANAIGLGGHLAAINDQDENLFATNLIANSGNHSGWIGFTDRRDESQWQWVNGDKSTFTSWDAGTAQPDANGADSTEDYAGLISGLPTHPQYYLWGYRAGTWHDFFESGDGNSPIVGLAEIPIISSITRTGTVREGSGLFTTSINLTAGTQTSGNLAEGAQVWWQVTGITADDLASGALTGSGVITNGKLDIQHSLVVDADAGEQFSVSVFSDSAMTQQIGSTNTVGVQESSPVMRGNSLYSIVDGPSWTQAEAGSVALGGHLTAITSREEYDFIGSIFSNYKYKSQNTLPSDFPNALKLWIGLYDGGSPPGSIGSARNWQWTTGEAYAFIAPGSETLTSGANEPYVWSNFNIPSYVTGGIPTQGFWQDAPVSDPDVNQGIAEIPLFLSIIRTGTAKEGAGVFTTSIILTAGTQA